MSKNFHEIDRAKRHIRMADIKLGMGDWKESKAELNAALKLLNQVEKEKNGKHDKASEPSGER